MALGTFTRGSFEAQAAQIADRLIATLHDAQELRGRAVKELAAGTLDGTDFYATDPTDKANILGALDDMNSIGNAVLTANGSLPALGAGVDYLRYIGFLLGM